VIKKGVLVLYYLFT